MLVKDYMTKHPIMISPDTLATEAQEIMVENKIRHLPVVADGKRLIGLVTRGRFALSTDSLGSLNLWEIGRRLGTLKVKQVMVGEKKVHTTNSNITIERAARIMMENKIGCLPVIDEDVVVGMLTETDLLLAFQRMLGIHSEGVRVVVRMDNKSGEFAKLMQQLGSNNLGVMGIGAYPTPRTDGERYDAVIKIRGADMDKVREVLSAVEGQELIDIRDIV